MLPFIVAIKPIIILKRDNYGKVKSRPPYPKNNKHEHPLAKPFVVELDDTNANTSKDDILVYFVLKRVQRKHAHTKT